MRVLDLGCGTGRDCFVLSFFVGEGGEVVGVDMTDEQLDVANKYLPDQMKKFGFKNPNVRFIKGYIEDLKSLDLPDDYFDVVISNCVVNLSRIADLKLFLLLSLVIRSDEAISQESFVG